MRGPATYEDMNPSTAVEDSAWGDKDDRTGFAMGTKDVDVYSVSTIRRAGAREDDPKIANAAAFTDETAIDFAIEKTMSHTCFM